MTVPGGSTTATFTVTAATVNATTIVMLTSSYGGLNATANVTVTAPVVISQPPTPPGNLVATPFSSTQVNLRWLVSQGSAPIASYLVQRCQGVGCANFAQIATAAGNSYIDRTVQPGTSYSYQVQALDTSGNWSQFSNISTTETPGAAPPSGIAFVQGTYSTPHTSLSTVTVAFNTPQVAGDLNLVVVGWNNSSAIINAVNDNCGNQYTLAVGPTVVSGALSQSIYYAPNIAACTNTVTVLFQGSATAPEVRVFEYQGADPNTPIDAFAQNTGSSTTATSGPLITTVANDLLFAADIGVTTTTGAGAGFTERLLVDGDGVEDAMAGAPGMYSATAPVTPAGSWIMQLLALRPPTAGGTPQPPTTPGNLLANASGVQINLTWTASTSSAGIASYVVERCQGVGCSNFAQIGTSPGASYSDPNLAPGTSYSYQVQAVDNAGNTSQFSKIATTVTQATGTAGLNGLSLGASTIAGGQTVTGTVSLTGPAGSSGAIVSLLSSNPAVASVPATVTVPAGLTNATFTITTQKVKSATPVVVTATYAGASATATLTVKRHN